MQAEKKDSMPDSYESGGSFDMKDGKVTYNVRLFFNNDKKITIEDKLKKMIKDDVKEGNF